MSFVDVLAAAVAGTQRQTLPASPADDPHATPESRLLRAAAFHGVRRLAGRPLARVQVRDAAPAPPPETLREITPAAAVRLAELLEDRTDLLPEWLRLAADCGYRVPYVMLPDLLDYAREVPELQSLIQRVGGERLAWLAALNPLWSFAASADAEARFGNGTRDECLAAFAHIRQADPRRAADLLHETWATEPPDARAALLGALGDGLAPEDEPLLELGMQASRKEVRDVALRLLCRLPESRFADRWTARTRSVVQLESGALEVRVPALVPPEWLADGLQPNPPKGMGSTAWLVEQAVSFTPPRIWPAEFMAAILHSDWTQPLVRGLSRAAGSYRDAEWCDRLLIACATHDLPINASALVLALDQHRAESVLRRLLEIDANGAASYLGLRDETWSLEFSRAIVPMLNRADVLRHAALRLDPSIRPELPQSIDSPYAVIRVIDTLELRATMRQELGA